MMQKFNVAGTQAHRRSAIAARKCGPNGNPDTYWSDHWSCRFEGDGDELLPPSTWSSCSEAATAPAST